MDTTTNKKTKAAIYLRVSTDEQLKGYGLAVQEEKLRAFVVAMDYDLKEEHVYKEEGFSGSLPLNDRPNLKHLMEDAKNKAFDIVVVWKIDRLSRNVRVLLDTIEDFRKCNVGFRSMSESFDTTSSAGKFQMLLLGGVAEMERDTIRERTMGGRIAAAKDGKWVTGIPPYGYDVDKKTQFLKINRGETKWVKMFFKWIVADRLSLREVQQKANDLKIPLPRRKMSNKKTLNYWHKRTIGRMLTNETYTGTAYFQKYKRPFKNLTSLIDKNLLREKGGWIAIKVPPIVSIDMFERCKQQLLKNREFSKRNLKRTYLFSKIIYCGACGFKLFGGYQPSKKEGGPGTKYYHGVCSKDKVGTSRRCKTCEQIAEARLLPIWDHLKAILKRPEITLEKLAKYNAEKAGKDDTEDNLKQIEKTLASLATKRKRIALVYAEEEIDHESYKKILLECRAQEDHLNQEQMRLQRLVISKKEVKEMSNVINTQYKRITEKLDSLTYEQQQEALRLIVKRVIVYPKKAEAEVELSFNHEERLEPAYVGTGHEDTMLRDNNAR